MSFIFILVIQLTIEGHLALGVLDSFDTMEHCQAAIALVKPKMDTSKMGCMQVVRADKEGNTI